MNKSDALIVYKGYIPDEIISEFTQVISDSELLLRIATKKEEDEYYNFDGEIYDIVVYIKTHWAEFIANGFVAPLIGGIFVVTIKTLWRGLKNLKFYKNKKFDISEGKKRNILIRIGDENKSIEIFIEENFELDDSERVIQLFGKLLEPEKLNAFLSNPDYFQDLKGKPKIRIAFNSETQQWEIVNYKKIRLEFEKFLRDTRDKFEN